MRGWHSGYCVCLQSRFSWVRVPVRAFILKMDIKDMQKEFCKLLEDCLVKRNSKHNKFTVFPHLVEEVGELAREYNHFLNNWREDFDKENFSKEVVDILCQTLLLARDFDIDIESTFKNKIKEWRKRFELD
jgi:NTP pyrophosphatase (non-canonical NTP hydrolase)